MASVLAPSQRQQPRKLGRREQQYAETQRKKLEEERASEEAARARRQERFLSMAQDPRFKEITGYRERPTDRLDKMVEGILSEERQPRFCDLGPPIDSPGARPKRAPRPPPNPEFDRLVHRLADDASQSFPGHAAEKFGGRIRLEDSFKSKVKHLMVDFQLTEDNDCRESHLERMHHWFAQEGEKQGRTGKATRKAAEPPRFLTFGKDELPPPGSARQAPLPANQLTLGLAASWGAPESARLARHFGVVKGPGPPGPGYK